MENIVPFLVRAMTESDVASTVDSSIPRSFTMSSIMGSRVWE